MKCVELKPGWLLRDVRKANERSRELAAKENTVKHQVNLEYLAEAANLLMGPQGALRLSVVYTTIENVAKRHYEAGERDGEINGYEQGYVTGSVDTAKKQMQDEREEIAEAYRVADELASSMWDPSEYTPMDSDDKGFDHYDRDETVVTLNEAAHGDDDVADIDLHKTHYDIWNGRFHRPGAAE